MKKQILFLALIIISGLFIEVNGQFTQQQVIPGELPDPSIIEVDGLYYATGSSNDWGPVYPVYMSDDLLNWTLISHVFPEPPDWTINSYWAPELYYQDGTFYCFYTARRKDGVSCIGVATTDNIHKGFTDHGVLIDWGKESIDAFVVNVEGKLYISWKAYGLDPDKPIQILGAELSPDGLKRIGDPFTILTAENSTWEEGGMEGQCIIQKDDYLYMLYSGNGCCGALCNYMVGVARAKSIIGPWEKNPANPVLSGNKNWQCPGHGTAINTRDSWQYLYHAYPSYGFPYLGRTALLSALQWDSTTNWPCFTVSTEASDPHILTEDIYDDFNKPQLDPWWVYDLPASSFTVKRGKGKLVLSETKQNAGYHSGTVLGVAPEYADFTMSTTILNANEALKGLVFYATGSNSLGLGARGDSLLLWKVQDGHFKVLNRIALSGTKELHLRALCTAAHEIEFQYGYTGSDWTTLPDSQTGSPIIPGDNLAWWSWGIRTGMMVKSDPESSENTGVFGMFSMEYRVVTGDR